MSPDEMLDYSLGLLEPARSERVERHIASDPQLAEQVDRLGRNLRRLLDDEADIEPPTDLRRRTLERVERRRRWSTALEMAPARAPFRLADLAVAAGIFLAGLLTLIPVVARSQLSARTAQCTQNLHKLGVALIRYATTHNEFPYTDPRVPASFAGTFAVHLQDQGLLDDTGLLDCPVNGPNPIPRHLPSFQELNAQEVQDLRSQPCLANPDYAYNIGFVQGGTPRPLPANLPERVPLLADRPVFDGLGHALPGNSPNHGHAGQNVLTVGGSVQNIRSPRFNLDSDIYHNRRNATAPGLDVNDYVLGSGITRFDGKSQ